MGMILCALICCVIVIIAIVLGVVLSRRNKNKDKGGIVTSPPAALNTPTLSPGNDTLFVRIFARQEQ
jgi:hypothetical protein